MYNIGTECDKIVEMNKTRSISFALDCMQMSSQRNEDTR